MVQRYALHCHDHSTCWLKIIYLNSFFSSLKQYVCIVVEVSFWFKIFQTSLVGFCLVSDYGNESGIMDKKTK